MTALRVALRMLVIGMLTSCTSLAPDPASHTLAATQTIGPTTSASPGSPSAREQTPTGRAADHPTATAPQRPTHTPPRVDVPIGIEVENYLEYADALAGYGPFHVYGWVADTVAEGFDVAVEQLGSISSPEVKKKMLLFSSHHDLSRRLDFGESTEYRPDDLKALGISAVFYNSERGLTPPDEMEHLLSNDPDQNSVAIFATIAKRHGFEAGWGPIAYTAYTAPEETLSVMFAAGLDRIGLQEQKTIDDHCVADRVAAIRAVKAKYEGVAGRPVGVGAQIMPGYEYSEGCYPGDVYAQQNCPEETIGFTYGHCSHFVASLETSRLVESVAIWAVQPVEREQLVRLVHALRR